jgi:hypothetical protein
MSSIAGGMSKHICEMTGFEEGRVGGAGKLPCEMTGTKVAGTK